MAEKEYVKLENGLDNDLYEEPYISEGNDRASAKNAGGNFASKLSKGMQQSNKSDRGYQGRG